jgi:AcrR family transcriptional regulator
MRADATRNRDSILRAARELIAQQGVSVSLDGIASRAGVGPGTLHRHFPSKHNLLTAILVEVLEQRTAAAREQLSRDPAEALADLINGLLDDGRANAAVKAALAQEGFDLRAAAPQTVGAFDAVLDEAVRAAKQAGSVRQDLTARDVAAVIAGALSAQQLAPAGREAYVRDLVLRGLHHPR